MDYGVIKFQNNFCMESYVDFGYLELGDIGLFKKEVYINV